MNASKENAAKALKALAGEAQPSTDALRFVTEFITAAQRKLPTEAAYAKEKQRNKKPKMAKV